MKGRKKMKVEKTEIGHIINQDVKVVLDTVINDYKQNSLSTITEFLTLSSPTPIPAVELTITMKIHTSKHVYEQQKIVAIGDSNNCQVKLGELTGIIHKFKKLPANATIETIIFADLPYMENETHFRNKTIVKVE